MQNPNLPQNKITVAVISPQYNYITTELERLDIKVISSVEADDLPYNERYHADMQIHNIENKTYLLRNSCSVLKKSLVDINDNTKIIIEEKSITNKYPHNISLNGAFIGDYYICKKSHSNTDLLRLYINNGVQIIDVNQGYAKCSTVIISNNAIITDDEAIYNKCKTIANIDALKISKGSVMLDGYNYGFIGGCCFKIDKNILAFCGDVKTHRDYDNIKAFCKNYSVDVLNLSNKPLVDVGGAVALI